MNPRAMLPRFFTLLCCFLLLLLGSCRQGDDWSEHSTEEQQSYRLKQKQQDFSLTLIWDENRGMTLPTEYRSVVGQYLQDVFAKRMFKLVESVEVLYFQKGVGANREIIISLVGRGVTGENDKVPIAVEFFPTQQKAEGASVDAAAGVTHSCSGAPCKCCQFIREYYEYGLFNNKTSSRIIGCKCNSEPESCFMAGDGHCNHTTTTTP